MARPHKQTVDYFPHDCDGGDDDGKRIGIIQAQFGNDGYAFFYKLYELLGRTDGHSFNFESSTDWLFLLSKTHVTSEKAEKILETLARIDCIDKDLLKKKIIWSNKFVDNVADVYKRRKVELPLKPDGKSKKSKPKEKKPAELAPVENTSNDDLKVAGMVKYYEEEIGGMISPKDYERLKDYADNYPDGWFERAVDEAKINNPKSPMPYSGKIMERWYKEEKPEETSEDNQGIDVI